MSKKRNGNSTAIIEISDPLIREFFSTLKKDTCKTYQSYFRRLMEFEPALNGQTMLDEKDLWERTKCLQFKRYLEAKGYSENMQKSAIGAIRGFFSHNRKQLFFSQSEKKQVNTAANEGEGIFFSRDEIIRMWNLSTLTDYTRWILCNKTMGFRASDFTKITYGRLRGIDLTQEAPIFLGKIKTGKESVIANVFLDADVIKTISELLELHKDAQDEDLVFPCRDEHLSYLLRKLAIKAQVNIGEKEVSFHALRRFLYDRLTNVMSDEKAKMIIGKKTKESSYLSNQELRENFKKVLAEIGVNGNGQVKKDLAETKSTVDKLIKMLAEKDEEIKTLKATIDNRFEELRREFFGESMKVKARIVEPELKE
jgi:site-specific recombinase XerD